MAMKQTSKNGAGPSSNGSNGFHLQGLLANEHIAWLFEPRPEGVQNLNIHYANLVRNGGLLDYCKTELVDKAFFYIVELFENSRTDHNYHNLRHTLDVFVEATLMGRAAGLDEDGMEELQLAALFHDAGRLYRPGSHEALGAEIATNWMRRKGFSEKSVEAVTSAIMATLFEVLDGRFVTEPRSLMEALLCDADLASRGREDFRHREAEFEREDAEYGKAANSLKTLALLRTPFMTQVARELGYEDMRLHNLAAMEKELVAAGNGHYSGVRGAGSPDKA